jgi:hypothetical protein
MAGVVEKESEPAVTENWVLSSAVAPRAVAGAMSAAAVQASAIARTVREAKRRNPQGELKFGKEVIVMARVVLNLVGVSVSRYY